MKPNFVETILNAKEETGNNLLLIISPSLMHVPLPIQVYDDPFLPFGKAIINATQDIVCGYVFDMAAYLAIGAAGAVAMERTIAYVPKKRMSILHAPFYGPHYAAMAGEEAFAADAVTLVSDNDLDVYMNQSPYMAFVLEKGLSDASKSISTFSMENHKIRVVDASNIIEFQLVDGNLLRSHLTPQFTENVRAALLEMRS